MIIQIWSNHVGWWFADPRTGAHYGPWQSEGQALEVIEDRVSPDAPVSLEVLAS